jgi:Group II intron, maturase-specific domain
MLGFGFYFTRGGKVRIRVDPKALGRLKMRIRELTPRRWSIVMPDRIARINRFTTGWMGYFRLADTPRVFSDLDEWFRRRMRAPHVRWCGGRAGRHGPPTRFGAAGWPDGPRKDLDAEGRGSPGRWWNGAVAAPTPTPDGIGPPSRCTSGGGLGGADTPFTGARSTPSDSWTSRFTGSRASLHRLRAPHGRRGAVAAQRTSATTDPAVAADVCPGIRP